MQTENDSPKIQNERNILHLAIPLLKKIYGEFEIDQMQIDKPDAAIICLENNVKIGIEITTVDKQHNLQYKNDDKINATADELILEEFNNLNNRNEASLQPIKKDTILYNYKYIAENVLVKSNKYESYNNSKKYDELIILAFSDFLSIENENFEPYYLPWTNYLLSDSKFPFDKVIYVCLQTKRSILVYDKKKPSKDKPTMCESIGDYNKDIMLPVLKTGTEYNLLEIASRNPKIEPKRKKKKKGF